MTHQRPHVELPEWQQQRRRLALVSLYLAEPAFVRELIALAEGPPEIIPPDTTDWWRVREACRPGSPSRQWDLRVDLFVRRWGLTFEDDAGHGAVHSWCWWRRREGERWRPLRFVGGFGAGHVLPDAGAMVFTFTARTWQPDAESREEAAARLRAENSTAFERALTAELDRVEALYARAGLTHRTTRGRSATQSHLRWLFAYQAQGRSFGAIAKGPPWRTEKAVSDAVKTLAAQMGLILRPPGRGGRPRKV